jgi:hypothetical protein
MSELRKKCSLGVDHRFTHTREPGNSKLNRKRKDTNVY